MHRAPRDRAGMALGLDREQAAGADQDVVDVAPSEARVVDHAPLAARQLVEQTADLLLAGGAAVAALHQRQHEAQHDEHRISSASSEPRKRALCRPNARPTGGGRPPARRGDQCAHAQAQHGRARVLTRATLAGSAPQASSESRDDRHTFHIDRFASPSLARRMQS